MIYPDLLATFPIISDQVDRAELGVILRELEKKLARGEVGAVVEFGCYSGTTSLFIRRLMDHYALGNEFHVYDSFAGLPEKTTEDISVAGDQFRAGELTTSKKDFLMNFKKASLAPPVMHKGWFTEVSPASIPSGIMFAFLDGDYYRSIKDSFRLITPKLAPEAVIVVDDYMNEALPGAARATDEWLKARSCQLRTEASLGIIQT